MGWDIFAGRLVRRGSIYRVRSSLNNQYWAINGCRAQWRFKIALDFWYFSDWGTKREFFGECRQSWQDSRHAIHRDLTELGNIYGIRHSHKSLFFGKNTFGHSLVFYGRSETARPLNAGSLSLEWWLLYPFYVGWPWAHKKHLLG